MNPREVAGLASHPDLPAALVVPAVVQHGGQPGRPVRPGDLARAARAVLRPVPGRQGRGRAGPAAAQGRGGARRLRRGGAAASSATSWSTPACAAGSPRSRRAPARPAGPTAARRRSSRCALLKRGDVIEVPTGKFAGYAVVIDPGWDAGQPAALRRHRRPAGAPAGDDRLPGAGRGGGHGARSRSRSTAATRRCAATWPRRCAPAPTTWPRRRPAGGGRRRAAALGPGRSSARSQELRDQLRAHPCHACPDREDHDRWAQRWFKLDRDAATLRRRVENRTNTVARQFDRVCDVLTALGYLGTEDGEVRVTDQGRHLMRLYSELDLVAAESCAPGSGTTSRRARAGGGAVGAGLRGPPARRRLAAAGARAAGSAT